MGGMVGHHPDIESAIQHHHRPSPIAPPHQICQPPHELWFSWLVPLIFMVDVGLFVYTMYVNNCPATTGVSGHCLFSAYLGRFSFQPFSENHMLGPSSVTLMQMGALQPKLVVEDGQIWRLFSCMWLHGGLFHLLANMMSLLFIGIPLEKEFGFLKIGPSYVLSGLGGSLSSSIYLRSRASVGASGALFGLLGAMLSELIMNWTLYANKCVALSSLLLIVAINMALGKIPGVDMSAHVGGFVSGFLLGFILLVRPQFGWVTRNFIPQGNAVKRVKSKYNCCQYLLWITALVGLVSGYAISLVKLYRSNSTG